MISRRPASGHGHGHGHGLGVALALALAGCGADAGASGPFGCGDEEPALDDLPGDPWICPNAPYLTYCERLVGVAHPGTVILSNRGADPLEISEVRIRGDVRCSFRAPSVDVTTIAPNGTAFVAFEYFPQVGCGSDIECGDDEGRLACFERVALEVDSNAANFATAVVPVCGTAIAGLEAACDECPFCEPPDASIDDLACAPEE